VARKHRLFADNLPSARADIVVILMDIVCDNRSLAVLPSNFFFDVD
jgi:hypothetical protein